MATVFGDDDADLSLIQDRHVAVVGYGSQGPAHALSLRDCGVDVRVGLTPDSHERPAVEAEGLRVTTPYEACEEADLVVVLAPEEAQGTLFADAVGPNLLDGDALVFSSGFAIRYGLVRPPADVDVTLVAPVAPGRVARREYTEGRGVPVLVGVEQDATGEAWALALSYVKAIGGLRAGGIETTFAEATESRLFGELAVVGGVRELIRAGFETLVDVGTAPEVAYVACLAELREAADSALSAYGSLGQGRVIGAEVRRGMRDMLRDIQDETYASRFVDDQDAGGIELAALQAQAAQHPMESVSTQVRAMMAWLARGDE